MRINSTDGSFANGISKIKKNENFDKNENFLSVFKEKLDDVNEKQIHAEKTTQEFIEGGNVDIHQVMISTQEAKLSLELAVEIRNKLVDAYKEISRMQI
ncbi:flagellar hook-basal body complex protein FliE [Clostridium tepidiprofundi DSM 19306]|uniref:Flagellar hook-basal body complex protein FliE n=1 Tax=Clostridium tepidiprofundi DSM 19306 TaxID=1121338 RepID=A0A151B586_9CLOT|nr:flagellar hook-basal body complex protein FliE [Clostridium tepidiprofundi]KYH35081.1 flagellar hook-basal body complex protein FliE [Clostridium tepidiprofundi DSM 19306]